MSIRHRIGKKKNYAAWLGIAFPFEVKKLFLTEGTEELHKIVY